MKFILLFVLFVSHACYGQQKELKLYLDALKTPEFDESKAIVDKYSFREEKIFTLSGYGDITGKTFSTDVATIPGYKAIVTAKAKTERGSFAEKRFLAVMYNDKKDKRWKIYNFREAVDPCSEYTIAKSDIDDNKFYTTKQHVYRNLAYWSLMCGKLADLPKTVKLAKDAAKEEGDNLFYIDAGDIYNRIK